jgi:hypothetical protein
MEQQRGDLGPCQQPGDTDYDGEEGEALAEMV